MPVHKTISLLVLLLASAQSAADPNPYLKTSVPIEAGNSTRTDPGCGITEQTLKTLVEDVFTENRINPGTGFSTGAVCPGTQMPESSAHCRLTIASLEAFLHVALTCSDRASVAWASYKKTSPGADIAYVIADDGGVGRIDVGGRETALMRWVELEITDFIRTNSDLLARTTD